MVRSGDVLEIPALGMRIEFRRTTDETLGELLRYDVIGRPRGFPAQRHVHPGQAERHQVISGSLLVSLDGRERVLGPGESIVIPAGAPHRHYAPGQAEGHVCVELRPALRTAELLERLAALSESGQVTKRGYLRPVAAARLIRDFPGEGRAAQPPAAVQKAFSDGVLAVADAIENRSGEYVFVDEWDVSARVDAVFEAVSDATTYPQWWSAVYKDVEADGPLAVGQATRHHFQGRLPYQLRTTVRVVELDPPHTVASDVEGDLRGHGRWTITETGEGSTHVRFDWHVFADRPLLRVLTPALRPLLRWNHAWSIARAIEGLEPWARERGGQRAHP